MADKIAPKLHVAPTPQPSPATPQDGPSHRRASTPTTDPKRPAAPRDAEGGARAVSGQDTPPRIRPRNPLPDGARPATVDRPTSTEIADQRYDPDSGRPPKPGEIIAIGINPNAANGGVIRAPHPDGTPYGDKPGDVGYEGSDAGGGVGDAIGGDDGSVRDKPKPGEIIAIGINPNAPNGGVIRAPWPDGTPYEEGPSGPPPHGGGPNLGERIGAAIGGRIEHNIRDFFGDAATAIRGATELQGSVISAAGGVLSGVFGTAGDIAGDVADTVGDAAHDVLGGLFGGGSEVAEGAVDVAEEVAEGATDVVEDVVEGATDVAGTAIDVATDVGGAVLDSVLPF